jgi:hypothetical protein
MMDGGLDDMHIGMNTIEIWCIFVNIHKDEPEQIADRLVKSLGKKKTSKAPWLNERGNEWHTGVSSEETWATRVIHYIGFSKAPNP